MKFIDLEASSAFEKAIEERKAAEKLVVCGPKDNLDILDESFEVDFSVDDIIQQSKRLDVPRWFEQRRNQWIADFREEPLEEGRVNAGLSEIEGEWPGDITDKPEFMSHKDILTQEPIKNLAGALVPVDESWMVPAAFYWGGWNECPTPEEHCAIWQYWQEKYGAYIVAVGADIIEAYVERPPKTQQAAMELAWQQYLYCNDLVDQGMETISNLAALLKDCETWYFWWD